MGRGFNSSDVAVWLKVQIAAGRMSRYSGTGEIDQLASRLGVSPQTISRAFRLAAAGSGGAAPAYGNGSNGYRSFAELVDRIVMSDRRAG